MPAMLCQAPAGASPVLPTSRAPAAHVNFQMPAWTSSSGVRHVHLHQLESSQWPWEATSSPSFLQMGKLRLTESGPRSHSSQRHGVKYASSPTAQAISPGPALPKSCAMELQASGMF